jgi:peroxiredoxin Q/BCP
VHGGAVSQIQVMDRLTPGQAAPPFEIVSDSGRRISNKTLEGRPALLFFYPQDGTPTCTNEAISFSSFAARFRRIGVALIGVSPDPVRSHQKFRQKYGLKMTLASDESLTTIKAFGLWGEKSTFGRTYFGVERATFLLDAEGLIRADWRQVRVRGHAEAVFETAKALRMAMLSS